MSLGSFSIISWNIDFMRSFTRERMVVALSFLQQYVDSIAKPTVIMLSEMLVSDLTIIQAQPWVRSGYVMTDIDAQFWESGYYGESIPAWPATTEKDREFLNALMHFINVDFGCDEPTNWNSLKHRYLCAYS